MLINITLYYVYLVTKVLERCLLNNVDNSGSFKKRQQIKYKKKEFCSCVYFCSFQSRNQITTFAFLNSASQVATDNAAN